MTDHHFERMRAIVAQAIAEAGRKAPDGRISSVHLIVYGGFDAIRAQDLYARAVEGTPAEGVPVTLIEAGSRYICWNCCGLRFESQDGMCPNCGEEALVIPEEIGFALQKVDVAA